MGELEKNKQFYVGFDTFEDFLNSTEGVNPILYLTHTIEIHDHPTMKGYHFRKYIVQATYIYDEIQCFYWRWNFITANDMRKDNVFNPLGGGKETFENARKLTIETVELLKKCVKDNQWGIVRAASVSFPKDIRLIFGTTDLIEFDAETGIVSLKERE